MGKLENDADIYDLSKLISLIWFGKWIIMFSMVMGIVVGSWYVRRQPVNYTVSLVVKPVNKETSASPIPSGLGKIANFAGIAVPGGNSVDFVVFKKLLFSEAVSVRLIQTTDLVRRIFAGEWNSAKNKWQEIPLSSKTMVTSHLKTLLTGRQRAKYLPPNAARLSNVIKGQVSLSKERDTGFITLYTATSNIELAKDILIQLVETTDNVIKEQFVLSGNEALGFYQEKLSKARVSEHREVLARMIAFEERKLMLATNQGNYVADVLMGPIVSSGPTSPKSGLILLMSILLGALVGVGFTVIISILRNKNRTELYGR